MTFLRILGRGRLPLLSLLALTGCSRPAVEYLKRGDTLLAEGKRADAEINYRKAISKDAKLGRAYLGIGKTSLQGNDYVEAYRALTVALQLMPDDQEVMRLQAEVATGAYLIDPKHPVYLRDNLLSVSDRMEAQNPKTPDSLKIRGLISATEGDHKTALDYFRAAYSRDPKQLGIKLLEIQAQRQTGDEKGAEAEARALIQNNPQFGPGYDWLQQFYGANKRTADIEDLLRRKAEANPENIDFQLQLARIRFRTGQKDRAAETVKSVAERPDENSPVAVGDFYMSVGETEVAIGSYRQALSKSPQIKRTAQKRIVMVLMGQKKFKEALALLTEVRKEDRNDGEAVRAEADIRAQTGAAGDAEIAIKIYREILEKSPGDSTVRFNLGQTLLARGDTSGRRELEKCVGTTPNHIPAITRLAHIYRSSNEPRELLNLAERILAADVNNTGARILKAEGLIGVGRASEARNLLSAPIDEPSLKVDASLLLARALVAEGQVARGEQELRKLAAQPGNDLRPLNALSDLLLAKRAMLSGPEQLAMGAQIATMWARVLAQHPQSQPVRRSYAKASYFAGQHEKVLSLTSESLDNDLEAQTLRAASLFAVGRQDEAIELLKKVVTAPNANVPLLEGLIAYVYTKAGDIAGAELYYNHILAKDPKSAFAMNNLAYILADRSDRLAQAHKLASEAVALQPGNHDFQDTLGYVLLRSGKSKEAASLFGSLVLRQARNPGIRYHYGLALLALGQRTQAGKELSAALQHSTDAALTAQIRSAQQQAQ